MIQPASTLTRERRIDWARIIENLQKVGMSRTAIADEVGSTRSSLITYADEDQPSEPPYYVGHCLVALWAVRTGCQLSDVPTRMVQLSVSRILRAHR